LNGFKTS